MLGPCLQLQSIRSVLGVKKVFVKQGVAFSHSLVDTFTRKRRMVDFVG